MKRDRGEPETLELVIEVPDRMELFPFYLEINLDGSTQNRFELASVDAAGRHVIHTPLPNDDDHPPHTGRSWPRNPDSASR